MTTTCSTGTISVGAGSTTVTGSGTAWTTSGIRPGDRLEAAGPGVPVAAVTGNTRLTLARPWPGAALSGANCDIWLAFDDDRALVAANALLAKLTGGTLSSLGGLAGGANQMPYRTGAGVMATTALTAAARGLPDDGDVATMRSTLGLGTAAQAAITQSMNDTTAGRLTKVGDFGIGLTGDATTITNIDDVSIASGLWRTTPEGTASGVMPSGAAKYGHLIQHRFSASSSLQIYSQTGGSTGGSRLYHRGYKQADSSWNDWRMIYDQRSIVGTVSQSGGAPTGAVVERGANANGHYTRWADGTQACWRSMAASSGAATTWTFPAAFSAAPVVSGTAEATVLSAVCLDSAPTATAASFSARDKADARRADTCHMRATGRWF